jgi:hypothetical protein
MVFHRTLANIIEGDQVDLHLDSWHLVYQHCSWQYFRFLAGGKLSANGDHVISSG